MNSLRFFLSFSILTPGLVWTVFDARAQTCTQAPSCSELGYTKSASDCAGKTILYCPFDKTKAYCVDEITCASLGFNDTVSECPGDYTLCPSDSTKGKCIFEARPGDLKYSLRTSNHNGWLLCNGASYSSAQYPELYEAIKDSFGTNLPSYSGYFLKAAATSSASSFKTYEQAGLPNITGSIAYGAPGNYQNYTSGALYASVKSGSKGIGNGGDTYGLGFDASKSNSIYGRSYTVTPQNYPANIFIYAGRVKAKAPSSCAAGNFLYKDGTCSSTYTSTKTLLGLVNNVYSYTGYKRIYYAWGGNKTASNRTAADAACKSQGGNSASTACDQDVRNFTSITIPSNSVVVSPNSSAKKYVLCFNENSYFTCNSSGCTRGGSDYTGTKYYYCDSYVDFYE
ncbi:MAG: tail fiber protein [Proteobacteria bacterium]|nr:tail fiber protein [Pseudomonadota bacterium]